MTKLHKIRSSNIIHNGFYQIQEDLIEHSNGSLHTYTQLLLPSDAAVILAQDQEGKFILNYEYRYPTKQFLLGCPGGLLEKNEDPILGGQRELLEETGYFAEEIYLAGYAYPFPGVCNQKIYYLFAKNAINRGKQNLDPLEIIEIQLKTYEELKIAIRTQTNIDAILCSALWFKENFS